MPRAVQVSMGRGVNLARPRASGPTAWPGEVGIIPRTNLNSACLETPDHI